MPGRTSVCALTCLILLAGCGRRVLDECRAAARAEDARGTAGTCERAFSRGGWSEAAVLAARAHASLGAAALAESLAQRLTDEGARAELWWNVGDALEGRRDLLAASAAYARARGLFATRGDQAGISRSALREGRVAWKTSSYREALLATDEAIRAAGHSPAPSRARLVLDALAGLFAVLIDVGDLPAARRVLEQVEASPAGAEVRTFLDFDRGIVASLEGNARLARTLFDRVAGGGPGVSDQLRWSARINLLELALDAGDVPLARADLAVAMRLFTEQGHDRRPGARTAMALARARLARLGGRPDEAAAAIDGAGAKLSDASDWAWKLSFERGRIAEARGDDAGAQAAYEESIRIIESLRGDQFDDVRPWLVAQKKAPYAALVELHARRGQPVPALALVERTQGRTFMETFAAASAPAGNARPAEDAALRIEYLRRLYPSLRSSPVLDVRPVPELLSALATVAVVQFFEAGERLYLFSIEGGRARVTAIGAPVSEVAALVKAWEARLEDQPAADHLGRLLFPAGALPGGETLYVVPSPVVARLPFAALRIDGRYLVQQRRLARVPSLTALAALRRGSPAGSQGAVVLANAGGDLGWAAKEARLVSARLPAKVFTGAQATSARLREAREVGLLHVAVHSGLGPAGAWLELGDRRVAAHEVVAWGLRPRLVVLASCASAVTRDPELARSLAASFLAAGTAAVVGTLWSVEDRITHDFVAAFYDQGGARRPAEALARVQRDWAGRRPASEWAPFVFYGVADG